MANQTGGASSTGSRDIRGVLIHGGQYVRYNVYGNLFEVFSKYVPPIRPIGRGAYGLVCAAVNSAVAATVDGLQNGKEGDDKIKMHTHSYCCLDYAQIYDVVRYRLHRMKKKLRDELDNKNTVQEYICPNCAKRYTALDALRLVSIEDEYFHCESCNGELVAESDKLASQGSTDGDDNDRRRRREKLEDMLHRVEAQLKPLMDQLARVKDLPAPEFGSLQAWEVRANAVARGANGDNANDSKSGQGLGFGGTPMPFVGETKVEGSGYGAPEVAMYGQCTIKSDVYSFGVVMLELLTGRTPFDSERPRSEQSLVRWATPQLHDIDALAKMVDPALKGLYPVKSISRFADVIALCVQSEPEFRPPMSEVVEALVRLVQRANMSKRTYSIDRSSRGETDSQDNQP